MYWNRKQLEPEKFETISYPIQFMSAVLVVRNWNYISYYIIMTFVGGPTLGLGASDYWMMVTILTIIHL